MIRVGTLVLVAGLAISIQAASAQTTPAPEQGKQTRVKLTAKRLKEMRSTWAANKPKLKACRAEVRAKGLIGDDRWFYIQDCMGKT